MKKRALDKVYDELDIKYSKMPNDKMQESIDDDIEKLQVEMENIQKQIDGMETSKKGLDDETRENLEKEMNKKTQKINNLVGYRKNRTQIVKIIEYRDHLEEKLANTIIARDDSKKAYNEAKKDFIEVSKLLKDEKKTMEMEQDEYNDLQIRKEDAEKEMKKQKEIFYKSQLKIEDLKSKIGKCDLAWRTLFVNKTWNDIHARATGSKVKYTKKVEKEKKLEEPEIEESEVQHEVKATVRKVQQSEVREEQNKESNLPAKITTWSRIKNFFKSLPAKIKEKFGKEDVIEEKKEEKKEKTSRLKSTKQQKDEFLEGLRQNVDADYRKEVREAKAQEYIDKHKAKEQDER